MSLAYSAHILNTCSIRCSAGYAFDRLRDSDDQWIRKIHFFDEEHFLVICCTYAQAKAFVQVQCMEMDLSFKMIQGSTNVFSISNWNEDAKRELNIRKAYAVC